MSEKTIMPMSVETIDGGRVLKKIDVELIKAGTDCQMRKFLKKPRVVTARFLLTPVVIEGTERVQIKIVGDVYSKNPPMQASETLGFFRDGVIHVDTFNPGEPQQMSLVENE